MKTELASGVLSVATRLRARLHGRHLLLLALLALAIVGVESYRAVGIVREVDQAQELVRSGQDLLESKRLDATEEELVVAREDFEAAEEKFASARSALRKDPVVWALGRLPIIGGQVRMVTNLAEIGQQAAGIGVEGVRAAEEFAEIRTQEEGTLPEMTMTIFERTDPHFAAIETRLAAVDILREEIGDGGLLPSVRSAVRELDAGRETLGDLVATYRRARAFVPEFLGFSGPKTYLILAHNNAELLPTGGLVSVIGTMRVEDGRIEDLDFEDAVEFSRRWRLSSDTYVEPPAPLKQYLLKDFTWNLDVSNWSPDFPTAAKEAQRFFELGGGFPVDGVIGINVSTLERLLAVTGPVTVHEYGVTVTSENAFDLTEEHTRVPFEPQGDRKEFVALLADEVLERVLRPAPGMWSPLVDAIQDLGNEKNLLLFAHDPGQQELIREFGWDGEVNSSSGDFLMLVDASVNSTKLNVVLEQTIDIEVRLSNAGSARTVVTVDYINNLAPWAEGRDPELVRKLMLDGLYGGYLRLFVPEGSRIVSVRDERREIGLEEFGDELGLTVFGRFFALPRDTRQRLVFEYIVPAAVGTKSDTWHYKLELLKQPGQQPLPVTLKVVPPERMEITSTVGNGNTFGADSELEFVLDRDWTLEFELSRRS
ncbi:MAG: DUF4012 domain-containing protein [Chloroflexi bacterium]|nr:DUF4012 domain-containing protein [Chloroflexota bacterium]